MLTRLIYASEVTDPMTPEVLQDIVDKARRSNQTRQITGMLAFDSRYFLQMLEGSREAVNEVYNRIVTDPRHQRLQILESVQVDERHFATWSMGFSAADAHGREILLRYSSGDQFVPSKMTASGALGLLRALALR